MNWFLRGKFYVLLVIFGPLALAWFTEQVLHLGYFNWCERVFGYGLGWLVWLFSWLLVIYLTYRWLRWIVEDRPTEVKATNVTNMDNCPSCRKLLPSFLSYCPYCGCRLMKLPRSQNVNIMELWQIKYNELECEHIIKSQKYPATITGCAQAMQRVGGYLRNKDYITAQELLERIIILINNDWFLAKAKYPELESSVPLDWQRRYYPFINASAHLLNNIPNDK